MSYIHSVTSNYVLPHPKYPIAKDQWAVQIIGKL